VTSVSSTGTDGNDTEKANEGITVSEQALPDDSTQEDDATPGAEAGPSPASWAMRGAFIGAVAGSVAGAGLGMLFAQRPETLAEARDALEGSGRHVARAAAAAAGEVVASRHLNQLLKGNGNGDRGELMKQAAKEAGAAAASAARDHIISLRGEEGSKAKGGSNGDRS
jgi:hypothetical protein